MQRVDIYIETDSTSLRAMLRKYGYVLECELHGRPVTREGFGRIEGTYNQAVLTALAEALARIRQPVKYISTPEMSLYLIWWTTT